MKPLNRPYQVVHYKLSFTMDPATDPKSLPMQVGIEFQPKSELQVLELDSEELQISTVSSAEFGNLKFEVISPFGVKVFFPKSLKKGSRHQIQIQYSAQIRSAHNGLFRVTDPDEPQRGPLFFTHLEPTAARKLFPCNDEPHDKATTEVEGLVPNGYSVLSNGELRSQKAVQKNAKAWTRFHWVLSKPHPTYLVAIAIGKFKHISIKVGKTELSIWAGETKLDKARYALEVTKKSFEFFEDYLGVKYPWSKYATVGIPTFLWGGMENTSSTHMNQERTCLNDPNSSVEKKRITNLAAHELAHQWFGDYVTMQWWDDVWLNESFASLMGTLATAHVFKNVEPEIEAVTDAWEDYFRQENGPRSHAIVDKELSSIDDAFDSINYTKGENILRMLSFYVGEDVFKKGVKKYLQGAAYGNATHQDFFNSMEEVSKTDLKPFTNSWMLHRGYPVLSYSGSWEPKTSTYTLTVEQRPNHPSDSVVFDFKLPVVFHRRGTGGYNQSTTLLINQKMNSVSIVLPEEPEWVTLNPKAIVLATWSLKEFKEDVIELQALHDPDELARIWATFQLLRPLKEGTGSLSSTAERVTLKLLEEDSSPYVRNAVLLHLQSVKSRWIPSKLGNGILALATHSSNPEFESSSSYKSDPHGWSQFRSELIGALGKVESKSVLAFLKTQIENAKLPLDDLMKSAQSIASLGDEKSAEILKSAIRTHSPRGYRYQFVIQYAFGAYQNPKAAQEISQIAKSAGSDLMGRIGNIITDNHVLKNSKEWALFLKEFTLTNDRFGDEVKARILNTIEDVKSNHVKDLLEAIKKESHSERLKEVSRKILDKNFAG